MKKATLASTHDIQRASYTTILVGNVRDVRRLIDQNEAGSVDVGGWSRDEGPITEAKIGISEPLRCNPINVGVYDRDLSLCYR